MQKHLKGEQRKRRWEKELGVGTGAHKGSNWVASLISWDFYICARNSKEVLHLLFMQVTWYCRVSSLTFWHNFIKNIHNDGFHLFLDDL